MALPKLRLLEEEEPELRIRYDPQLEEIQIQIMGTVQLEILKERLLRRFGWEVEFGKSHILYKETVSAPVMGYGHYEPLDTMRKCMSALSRGNGPRNSGQKRV